jgi:hypothetical protein
MKNESQIDATLRALGGTQPPPGLERRVSARLEVPRRRLRTIHLASAAAVAASIAISTFALSPALRELAVRNWPNASPRLIGRPDSAAHPVAGFGAASAVRVPTRPIPVVPIPAGQGRGRTRSSRPLRGALPHGSRNASSGGASAPRVSAVPAAQQLASPASQATATSSHP